MSPGTGWNVMTVGTIGDQNTSSWWDDVVGNHCWKNPPGGTFKPEISAPGQNVISVGIVPAADFYSTSIAAPQVAGTFAQLIGINRSEIRGSPVRMRAIVIAASHVHMVQAGSSPYRIDAKEGMGSLTSKWAGVIASRQTSGGIRKGDFGKKTFNASGAANGCWYRSNSPLSQSFTIEAGKYVRVAAVWNSNGYYDEGSSFGTNDFYTDILDANFDVRVYKANGQLKASSSFPSYNVEAVHFTAAAGESPYRLDIVPTDWPCSSSQMAVAWAYVTWNQP